MSVANFGIAGAQAAGDFQCRRLLIHSIDLQICADFPGEIDDQPRNVTRTGSEVDQPGASPRLEPAPHEMQNKPMTAEPAVEAPEMLQIEIQLR